MTGRRRELYDAVLAKIKQIVLEKVPDAFQRITLTISDYEPAIRGAMEAAFPGARARGCWFHYGQAIYRYATVDCKLLLEYRKLGVVRHIVKQLIAIALLPHNKIHEAYQVKHIIFIHLYLSFIPLCYLSM